MRMRMRRAGFRVLRARTVLVLTTDMSSFCEGRRRSGTLILSASSLAGNLGELASMSLGAGNLHFNLEHECYRANRANRANRTHRAHRTPVLLEKARRRRTHEG
jgi:hypothetical protein